MDLNPMVAAGRQIVQSYGEGRFRISGRVFDGSVLVLPEASHPWPVSAFARISFESFAAATGAVPAIELLLIGCGRAAAFLDRDLRQRLRAAGIVAETMDTGAACRTYNVLSMEGRRVGAALIAIA